MVKITFDPAAETACSTDCAVFRPVEGIDRARELPKYFLFIYLFLI